MDTVDSLTQRLKQTGLKCTPVRKCVLSVLSEAKTPLSVPEIIRQMDVECDESTVFRTLNAFVEKNVVTVAAVNDRTHNYSLTQNKGHSHFVFCRSCQRVDEINLCSVNPLLNKAEELGFGALQHRVEISGICESCSQ